MIRRAYPSVFDNLKDTIRAAVEKGPWSSIVEAANSGRYLHTTRPVHHKRPDDTETDTICDLDHNGDSLVAVHWYAMMHAG